MKKTLTFVLLCLALRASAFFSTVQWTDNLTNFWPDTNIVATLSANGVNGSSNYAGVAVYFSPGPTNFSATISTSTPCLLFQTPQFIATNAAWTLAGNFQLDATGTNLVAFLTYSSSTNFWAWQTNVVGITTNTVCTIALATLYDASATLSFSSFVSLHGSDVGPYPVPLAPVRVPEGSDMLS
ncbi:MAG: hypothetical protein KGR98_03245, partial [Verrucomicrobia bacterium]|nr:hypothetical protein [Verrucomicrobiota bacterium]